MTYSGIKVVIKSEVEDIPNKTLNTTHATTESFIDANRYYTLMDDDIVEKLNDEPELFKVDLKICDGRLDALYNIRQQWSLGNYDYREFLNKKEIKEYLEQDYCVAVEGLGEIENITELEGMN